MHENWVFPCHVNTCFVSVPCKLLTCFLFSKDCNASYYVLLSFYQDGPRAGIFQVRFPFVTATNTKEMFLFRKARKLLTKQQDHKVPFAELKTDLSSCGKQLFWNYFCLADNSFSAFPQNQLIFLLHSLHILQLGYS